MHSEVGCQATFSTEPSQRKGTMRCLSRSRFGIQFTMMATALAPASSTLPGKIMMTPTLSAQEVLKHAESTLWNRELRAASEIVSRRRQRRRKRRRRRLDSENPSSSSHASHHHRRRDLQSVMGGKYNSYLPEDAPPNLLEEVHFASCLSPLQKWFVSLIESIGLDTWEEIEKYNITSLAYLYKHHVSSADGSSEYFGTYGDRTDEMKSNHESLSDFWYGKKEEETLTSMAANPINTPTGPRSNVVLLGMHGVDLADNDAKLVPTLQQIYHMDGSEAYAAASKIQTIVQSLPGAFNNPVLTANAVAIQSLNSDGSQSERDSIIVGDGVFAFLQWLQLKDDGPDYIHSHEYGHHLQYDLGVETTRVIKGSYAEETRRWEMMADVFGSYYLAHSSGGRMDAKRLVEVHRAAFSLGDCEDAIDSHHGTPRQRECASNYGANLALGSYLDGGYKIPTHELRRMFDENYDAILLLDGAQCEAVVDLKLLDEAIYGERIPIAAVAAAAGEQKLETTSGNDNVPAPSPAGTSQYEPYSGYVPQSEYQPFDATQQNDWTYGNDITLEAYNPDENDWTYDITPEAHNSEENPSPDNELDAPPPRLQKNGTTSNDEEDWFGKTEEQWVSGRTTWSGGNSLGVGWSALFVAAALVKIWY